MVDSVICIMVLSAHKSLQSLPPDPSPGPSPFCPWTLGFIPPIAVPLFIAAPLCVIPGFRIQT